MFLITLSIFAFLGYRSARHLRRIAETANDEATKADHFIRDAKRLLDDPSKKEFDRILNIMAGTETVSSGQAFLQRRKDAFLDKTEEILSKKKIDLSQLSLDKAKELIQTTTNDVKAASQSVQNLGFKGTSEKLVGSLDSDTFKKALNGEFESNKKSLK